MEKLACFEAFFHMTVSFACLDLNEPGHFYWVPLRALIGRPVEPRGRARVLAFPIADALKVDMAEGFMGAYGRFSLRSLSL